MLWGLKDPFVKETARLKSFDLIQKYDTPTMSEDVVIVEIDENSIEQNGQWPWKRTVLADVIWRLREAGAGIIVLPILFSEEDRLGGDMDLAQALVQNGIYLMTAPAKAITNMVTCASSVLMRHLWEAMEKMLGICSLMIHMVLLTN